MKVFLLAETKSNILFCLGKQKIFSVAWENNYRYIFTCGNKAKDFLLLEKTTKYFFCLGNNHRNTFTCGNKTKDFLLLVKTKTNILF